MHNWAYFQPFLLLLLILLRYLTGILSIKGMKWKTSGVLTPAIVVIPCSVFGMMLSKRVVMSNPANDVVEPMLPGLAKLPSWFSNGSTDGVK